MLSRLFGKKPSIENLNKLLAQARRHLWNNELSDAEKLFNQVLKELDEVDPKTPSSEVDTARLQTRLGIWAISYFRRAEQRSKVQQICAGHSLDAETAFFVAKVFQIKNDRSVEAFSAYETLLRVKPTPKLAQKIGEMLTTSAVSNEALRLLEIVTRIAIDNVNFRSQLCRWYLKLNRKQHAHDMAREILLMDEQNIDGHRCLAYLAEMSQDWDTAIQHYSASRDWLRVAVAASKADRPDVAAQALAQVGEVERDNRTWLFYHGWVAFRQNNLTEARRAWQQLQTKYPSSAASALSEALAEHTTYHKLQSFDSEQDETVQPVIPALYEDVWTLRRGVIKLLLQGDVKGSKPLLQKAAVSLVAATYYALWASIERVAGGDASIYQFLIKQFGDASLFLWLRGLLMLQGKQANAIRYLLKAHQEGVFDRHLPLDAGRAASWLVLRLTSESLAPVPSIEINHLLSALDGKAPFIGSVLPSFVLYAVKSGADSSFLRDQGTGCLMTPSWLEVKSIVLASQREWQLALQSLGGANVPLKMRVIQHAVADAVRNRDWHNAAEYVGQGLAVQPDDPVLKRLSERLRLFMWQRLWALRELNALAHELEKRINADKAPTAAYHQLAIIYTQIALQRDRAAANGTEFSMAEHRTQFAYVGILEDQAHNDCWQLAVGYWAVALSERDYWRDWAQRRSEIYGEAVSSSQVQELIETRLPHLLQSYHQEQSSSGSKYAAHHRYYSALVKREIELTAAMHYWLRAAEMQRVALPNEMRRYVSPLLIKEYGYEQLARHVVAQSSQLRLSPYEAGLIREAFSPVSDVKALVEIKDYPTALERLRWLLGEAAYKEYHAELRRELVTVTRTAAAHFLADEKWEDAYNVALQGLEIQDHDKELEQTVVDASIGWAGEQVREDSHAAAIRRLEQVKTRLQGTFAELNQFLSEVYVEWALQAFNEDDLKLTVIRLERAIAAHSANGRARKIMSEIYNGWAVEKAQAERLRDALKDAETALRYSENARSLALIAMLNHGLAVQAAERNDARSADSYWVKAREFAFKHIESANTQESVDLFVQISAGYVIFLYSHQVFANALQIGEGLLELDYDPDAINVDMEELLSAICTDYGATLYNGGNRREGRKLTQKAVQYDPSNMVARQNLSRM